MEAEIRNLKENKMDEREQEFWLVEPKELIS